MFPIMVSPLILSPKPKKENKFTRNLRSISSESSTTQSRLVAERNPTLNNLRRTSTFNFGGIKPPLKQEQEQRRASVHIEPITKAMDATEEESTGDLDGLGGGLGIHFYDHLGNIVLPKTMAVPRVPVALSPRAPATQKPTMPLPKGMNPAHLFIQLLLLVLLQVVSLRGNY